MALIPSDEFLFRFGTEVLAWVTQERHDHGRCQNLREPRHPPHSHSSKASLPMSMAAGAFTSLCLRSLDVGLSFPSAPAPTSAEAFPSAGTTTTIQQPTYRRSWNRPSRVAILSLTKDCCDGIPSLISRLKSPFGSSPWFSSPPSPAPFGPWAPRTRATTFPASARGIWTTSRTMGCCNHSAYFEGLREGNAHRMSPEELDAYKAKRKEDHRESNN